MTWNEQKCRAVVNERAAGRCEVCGRQGESIHHRVKAGQGGQWAPSNTVRLCGDGTRRCHGWLEAHPLHAKALGLWLPPTATPADWPMYVRPAMFTRAWWKADDDGMWIPTDPPDGYEDQPEVAAAIAALHRSRIPSENSSGFAYRQAP